MKSYKFDNVATDVDTDKEQEQQKPKKKGLFGRKKRKWDDAEAPSLSGVSVVLVERVENEDRAGLQGELMTLQTTLAEQQDRFLELTGQSIDAYQPPADGGGLLAKAKGDALFDGIEAAGNLLAQYPQTRADLDYVRTLFEYLYEDTAPVVQPLTATVGTAEKQADGTTEFAMGPVVTLSNGKTMSNLPATDFDWAQVDPHVGEYPLTLNRTGIDAILAANPNYTLAVADITPGTVRIVAGPTSTLQASVGNITKVYDRTVDFAVLPQISLSDGATVPANLDASDFVLESNNADVGETTVTLSAAGIQKITEANPNTVLTQADIAPGTATITPAPATITANAGTKGANRMEPRLSATVSGVYPGDVLDYTVAREPGETMGEYAITVHVEPDTPANRNYAIEAVPATFTIAENPKSVLSAIVGSVNKTYDGTTDFTELPSVTLEPAATLPTMTQEDFQYEDIAPDAGRYEVTLSNEGIQKIVRANADVALTADAVQPGWATIAQAPATITVDNAEKAELSADPEWTASVSGVVAGDELAYTLTREPGETVGTYMILGAVDETAPVNDNYLINVENATLTIAPAVMKITIGEVSRPYDGTTKFDRLPRVTIGDDARLPRLTQDDFDFSAVRAEVGTYPVMLSDAGLGKLLTVNAEATPANSAVITGAATITKASATIQPAPRTKQAGSEDPRLTATISGVVPGETLAYWLTRANGDDVGTYPIKVVVDQNAAVNQNYTIMTTFAPFTVRPNVITAAIGNVEKTYDATPRFASAPKVTLKPKTATVPALVASDFDYSAVEKNVGTYPLTLNETGINKILAANPNTALADTDIKPGSATINKATATIAAISASKVAGQEDPDLHATVRGALKKDQLEFTVSRTPGEEVGAYTETVHVDPHAGVNGNYRITVARDSATFRINARAITAVVGHATKRYDGTPTLTDEIPTVTLSMGQTPELSPNDFDLSLATADVGDYPLTLNAAGIAKIIAANPSVCLESSQVTAGTLAITKVPITLTVEPASKVINTPDPEFTAAIEGAVPGDDIAYHITREPGEAIGQYALAIQVDETAPVNQNYIIKTHSAGARFTIAPLVLTAIVGGTTKAYDGTKALTALPMVELSAGVLPELDANDFDVSQTEAAVGMYPVTLSARAVLKILAANPDTTLDSRTIASGTVTVTKAAVTITADAAEKMVGDNDPLLEATVVGTAKGEELAFDLNRKPGETVGTYPIDVEVDETAPVNANYTITVKPGGALTIIPVAITATIGDAIKTYDGKTTLTALPTVSLSQGKVPQLNASAFETTQVDVGTGRITLSQSGVTKILNANPTVALAAGAITPGHITVKPATATLALTPASKLAGAADPQFAVTTTGVASGEQLAYAITREPGETVGRYALSLTVDPDATANRNYRVRVLEQPATLQIKPAPLSVMVGSVERPYDGTNVPNPLPAITLGNGRMPKLTAADFDLDAVKAGVGSYPITLNAHGIDTVLEANPNNTLYHNAITPGTFTVTPAKATLHAVAASKMAGTSDPQLTATVTGVAPGETLAYTVSRAPGEAIGRYDMTITVDPTAAVNRNYVIDTKTEGVSFTIGAHQMTATIRDLEKTYNGNNALAQAPQVTLTGGNLPQLTLADFDLTKIGAAAGTYPLTLNAAGLAKIAGANPNTELPQSAIQAGKLTVTKRPATIAADPLTKAHGEPDPQLTAKVDGVVAGEALTYTVTRAPGETLGQYPMTVNAPAKAGANINYAIMVGKPDALFTIAAKHASATVGPVTQPYTGQPQLSILPTVSLSDGTVPAMVASDFDQTKLGASVGTYPVTLSAAGLKKLRTANPGLALDDDAVKGGTVTITKAKATLMVNPSRKVAGQPDPELSATAEGVMPGERLAYTVDRMAGEEPGTYTLSLHVDHDAPVNQNYQIVPVVDNATFVIAANGEPVAATAAQTAGNLPATGPAPVQTAQQPAAKPAGPATGNARVQEHLASAKAAYSVHPTSAADGGQQAGANAQPTAEGKTSTEEQAPRTSTSSVALADPPASTISIGKSGAISGPSSTSASAGSSSGKRPLFGGLFGRKKR